MPSLSSEGHAGAMLGGGCPGGAGHRSLTPGPYTSALCAQLLAGRVCSAEQGSPQAA